MGGAIIRRWTLRENRSRYEAEAHASTALGGITLVNGRYVAMSPDADDGIYSEVLDLEFRLRDTHCGIYDPVSEAWLQTPAEAAEAEVARLREQLTRLQAHP